MDNWINFEQQKPKSQKDVLVCVKGDKYRYIEQTNSSIQIPHYYLAMATYFAPRTVLAEDWFDDYDKDFMDYDEENDCYWVYEGFYEYTTEHENQYGIANTVTHWMELPELPLMEEI